MKKVSVITINKNNAKGLERTIESVVGQTFKDYEFIVIDGGSDDGSIEVIERYAGYIDYRVSEPDRGIYHAMNKGIDRASGEYTIFMNSGDCFVSDEVLSKVFSRERHSDMIAGIGIISDVLGRKRIFPPNKITFYNLAKYSISHQALFTKRSLFDELGGYDENLKLAADWKFTFLATMKYQKNVDLINIDIALLESNGLSAQRDSDKIISEEKKEALTKYFPYFYQDYLCLHKIKRFTWYNLKIHIRWRLNRFFRK